MPVTLRDKYGRIFDSEAEAWDALLDAVSSACAQFRADGVPLPNNRTFRSSIHKLWRSEYQHMVKFPFERT